MQGHDGMASYSWLNGLDPIRDFNPLLQVASGVYLTGREACLVIVLTHDPHRLPRLGCSRGVNLRDVVIALSWLGRGDYDAADWEAAP
jgi:hypothetical protein